MNRKYKIQPEHRGKLVYHHQLPLIRANEVMDSLVWLIVSQELAGVKQS